MSPRGANLARQRAEDDAKIRSGRKPHKYALDPAERPPEAESIEGTVEPGPSKTEKSSATYAFRAIRKEFWARPTFAPSGELVAKELPDEYVLEFEDRDEIIERESPDFSRWAIVLTSFGFALAEPDRFPSLIEEAEIPAGLEFVAAGSGTFRLVEPLSVEVD